MLSINTDVVRLFIHILAATIWVGGQLLMMAMVPLLKSMDPDAPRAAAAKFAQVAWPAFAILVISGVWNILSITDPSSEYSLTLGLKLMFVTASGLGAAAHGATSSRLVLIVGGIVGFVGSIVALFMGVMLALGA